MKKIFLIIVLIFFNNILYAIELKGKFYQGNLILGKVDSKSKVFIDKKKIKVSDEGFFVFGLAKDRKHDVEIEVIKNDFREVLTKKVFKKKYLIQKIDGLPKKQVTPPKEFYARIKNDNKLIAKARSVQSDLVFFKDKFYPPLNNSFMAVKEY